MFPFGEELDFGWKILSLRCQRVMEWMIWHLCMTTPENHLSENFGSISQKLMWAVCNLRTILFYKVINTGNPIRNYLPSGTDLAPDKHSNTSWLNEWLQENTAVRILSKEVRNAVEKVMSRPAGADWPRKKKFSSLNEERLLFNTVSYKVRQAPLGTNSCTYRSGISGSLKDIFEVILSYYSNSLEKLYEESIRVTKLLDLYV